MTAIITGDIIKSRKLATQDIWLKPIKSLFNEWGRTPNLWEIYRGDSFQLEISQPEKALSAALRIKATIKSIRQSEDNKRISEIDIRMAIGIGQKTYNADRISESNGSAFIYSGEKLELLKKEKVTLAVKSEWPSFDKEINLYLKLALREMNSWTISSGELVNAILLNPNKNQTEIGKLLDIEQNSVSGRYKRSYVEELLELDLMYKEKLKQYI